MEHALEFREVTKQYTGFTLDRVSLQLPKGCIMGLIGENGAGKSTMIKLIMDLIRKDGGAITVLGQDSVNLPRQTKEAVGVVMDECCFPEYVNLQSANKIMKSIYRMWDETKFQELVQRFSLPEKKTVKEYSRGMKMKLSIAVALSHRPQLLVLDEATSGLDPVVRNEILDVFLDFIQDETHSIFMSSHILSDLEKACDYITFLHQGKVIFSDEKDRITEQYGVLKCSEKELESIDPSLIVGKRKNAFGAEALVLKSKLRGGYLIDNATVEDMMLFYIKEKEQ